MPDQIHQVGRVFAVMDRESGVEADLVGVLAKQTRADTVEGARPSQGVGHGTGVVTHDLVGRSARRASSSPTQHGVKMSSEECVWGQHH